MATRDQINERIQRNLNDTGIFYTNTDINNSIQDGYDEICAYSGIIVKATSIAVTANLTYYDLRTLISDFIAVRAIWSTRINNWLIPATQRTFDSLRFDWEKHTGEPRFFAPINYRYMALYPRSVSTSGNLYVFYFAEANTLDGGDTPQIPADIASSLIEDYVTADLFDQAEEWAKSQIYYKDYLENLENLSILRSSLRLPDYIPHLR